MPFTDNALKRLKDALHCLWNQMEKRDRYLNVERHRIDDLVNRLQTAEHALKEGFLVTTHPCFTVGSKAYEELPVGLSGRVAIFDEALQIWRKTAGK